MFGKMSRLTILAAFIITMFCSVAFASDIVVVWGMIKNEETGKMEKGKKEYSQAVIEKIEKDGITFSEIKVIDCKRRIKSVGKVLWKDVVSYKVNEDDRLKDFASGTRKMREGSYVSAIKFFERVVKKEGRIATELEVHLSIFRIVMCGFDSRMSDLYGKIHEYAPKLEQKFPTSYFLANAIEYWGVTYLRQNKKEEAKKIFTKLTTIAPARGYLKIALMSFSEEDYQKALSNLKKAKSMSKTKITTNTSNLYIGICYKEMKNWNEARKVFEELTGDNGSENNEILGKAYYHLGICLGHDSRFYKSFLKLMTAYTVYKSSLSNHELGSALGYSLICATKLSAKDAKWKKRAEALEKEFNRSFKNVEKPTTFP